MACSVIMSASDATYDVALYMNETQALLAITVSPVVSIIDIIIIQGQVKKEKMNIAIRCCVLSGETVTL